MAFSQADWFCEGSSAVLAFVFDGFSMAYVLAFAILLNMIGFPIGAQKGRLQLRRVNFLFFSGSVPSCWVSAWLLFAVDIRA